MLPVKKIPGNYFQFKKNPENIFLENPYTHLLTKQNYPEATPKTHFSDVIAIVGNQGHLQPVSPEKPAIINAKKRCPQKPAKLHGFIRFKMAILAK